MRLRRTPVRRTLGVCAVGVATLACQSADPPSRPSRAGRGQVQVAIATTGERAKAGAVYSLEIDGQTAVDLEANESRALPGLDSGRHVLRLTRVPYDCFVKDGRSDTVLVDDSSTSIKYRVTCPMTGEDLALYFWS